MEYNKKILKIAAKITAGTLSEIGELDSENAKKTVAFLKTVYNEIAPIKEDENCVKDAFKAAGKITASACEEMEDPDGETAAKFFKTVYEGIAPLAEEEDFDEDVFKYVSKITAAACEEMEEPTEEKAKEAAEFFKTVYFGLLEEEPACEEEPDSEEEPECEESDSEEAVCAEKTVCAENVCEEPVCEEKKVCAGKYIIKETASGISFRLAAGNNQVIGISEVYSSKAALEKGIESVRKNAPIANLEDQTAEPVVAATCPKFEIYEDKAGEFRFRLKAKNGEIILASEGYKTKASCENGIESVRKNAPAEIKE